MQLRYMLRLFCGVGVENFPNREMRYMIVVKPKPFFSRPCVDLHPHPDWTPMTIRSRQQKLLSSPLPAKESQSDFTFVSLCRQP